jgi:hypothetical protein
MYMNANANDLGEEGCTSAMSAMKSFGKSTCVRESFDEDTGSATYLITIHEFPEVPHENNRFQHDGNPPLAAFRCDMTEVIKTGDSVGAYCQLSDANTENIPGYYECARHGKCNSMSGACSCESGYRGDSCSNVKDSDDILSETADGPFFSGSVLKISAVRKASPDFNYLSVLGHNNKPITTISGTYYVILLLFFFLFLFLSLIHLLLPACILWHDMASNHHSHPSIDQHNTHNTITIQVRASSPTTEWRTAGASRVRYGSATPPRHTS